MSELYDVRRRMRDALVAAGLWAEDEILIRRRGNLWNDVAVAVGTSARRQCLVIGLAKARRRSGGTSGRRQMLALDVTIPVTLIELPFLDEPEADVPEDEDSRWEATLLALQGEKLGRQMIHHRLEMREFEEVEDEEYLMRQAIFEVLLTLASDAPRVGVTWENLDGQWEC
jgi:hypothetical protein